MAGKYNEHGLTPKQENFARNVADGMSLSDAYRAAYDAENMSNEAIHTNAHKLGQHAQVAIRVNVLAEERVRKIEEKGEKDRDKVVSLLRKFAIDDNRPDHVRLRALELLGKTCGAFVDVIDDKRERPAVSIANELERRMTTLLGYGLNAKAEDDSLSLVAGSDPACSGEESSTVQ